MEAHGLPDRSSQPTPGRESSFGSLPGIPHLLSPIEAGICVDYTYEDSVGDGKN
jgi:hypothetical protein